MQREEKIQILKDIIKIDSINDKEKEVADYLANLLKAHGISSKNVEYDKNRDNLVAEIGKGNGRVLGYSGHMDVVDPGDLSDWTYPPFEAKEVDGKIYGRGSTDMKSGLAAMVIAMIELTDEKVELDGTLRLLATMGEEIGELGSNQLTKEGYADDLDALVVGEPSNYNLCYANKGALNYILTSHGKEAHSSMPELGINAINNMTVAMEKLNTHMNNVADKHVDDVLGKMTHNITVIHGGSQVNSIPGSCTIQGNMRTTPACDNDLVRKEITSVVNRLNKKENFNFEVSFYNDVLAAKSDVNSKLITDIQGIYDQKFGGHMPVVGIPAGTDASEFIRAKGKFDFVIFGPGENNLPHKANEYVEIQNYLDMIDIYKEMAKKYINE